MMMRFNFKFLNARRTLLLAALLAAGSCGLWAQAGTQDASPPDGQMRQRGPNPEREIAQLTEVLSLTPDQQTQVKALLKDRREKVEALRANGARPAREQMEAIRKESDTKINALLSDDQKTKYAAWEKERMERRRGGGGPDGPPPPPQSI